MRKLATASKAALIIACLFLYQNCGAPVDHGSNSNASTQTPCTTTGAGGIAGSVTDATNKSPLSGVNVTLVNMTTGKTTGSTSTTAGGSYSFSGLNAGNYELSFTRSGYITFTQTSPDQVPCTGALSVNAALSTVLAAGQMRIVLSWTSAPSNWSQVMDTYQQTVMDMDSYLLVPGNTSPIYWNNCDHAPAIGGSVPCNVAGAYLDVDQFNWAGPETVTITQQVAGTYTYYITNYSDPCNANALANSLASVTVYAGSQLLKQFTISPGAPPNGNSGKIFEVFTMSGGQITPVLQYNDGLPVQLASGPANGGTCDQEQNQ